MTAEHEPGSFDLSAEEPRSFSTELPRPAASRLNEDELLTTAEVARMLRLPGATLRTWRYQGIGPRSFHLGPRGIRYKGSDVAIWLDRQYGATS